MSGSVSLEEIYLGRSLLFLHGSWVYTLAGSGFLVQCIQDPCKKSILRPICIFPRASVVSGGSDFVPSRYRTGRSWTQRM
jgi:hypothetical protein